MANITVTSAAVFIPEVWSAEVQKAFRKALVFASRVKRMDSLVSDNGDTIHVPKVAQRTANDKTAGNAVTYDAANESEFTLSINKNKYSAFILENIARVQSKADLRRIYTDESGYAIATAVDSDIAALYSGLSQSTAAGNALDDTAVLDGLEKLDVANVPSADRHLAVHAEGVQDLRAVSKYTEYQFTGQTGVANTRSGNVERVYGTEIVMSNNVVESAGTPNILHNLLWHREAFALAMQSGPTVWNEKSTDYLGWKFAVSNIYGVAEYRDEAAVDMQLNS